MTPEVIAQRTGSSQLDVSNESDRGDMPVHAEQLSSTSSMSRLHLPSRISDEMDTASSPVAVNSSPSYYDPETDSSRGSSDELSSDQEIACDTLQREQEQVQLHKEPKYIVFESSLRALLKWCHCPLCGSVDIMPLWTTTGTQLNINLMCDACDTNSKWSSQPNIGTFPAGNILLSAGILFAGTSPTKVLRVLNSIGVVTHTVRSFSDHQAEILQPAIKSVWEEQQTSHLTQLLVEDRPLVLGGDGRADSPGHSAKFGVYTTMELQANVILDLQLVQVSLSCGHATEPHSSPPIL